jgi:hypothetical protein
MGMQMLLHGLTPGMQDHREPDLAAQILVPELLQELCGNPDEQIEEQFLIEGDQGIEDMVDGEDNMKVVDGQQPFVLFFQPLGFLERAALGAMTVLTGFAVELPLLTHRTLLHDATQRRCAALHDRIDRFRLLMRKSMKASVRAHVLAEDLSHVVWHPGLLR